MEKSAISFLTTPSFAVAGSSAAPTKSGYKVLAFYHTHSLPVTAINPTAPVITLPSGTAYTAVTSVTDIPDPTNSALSIVTGPKITKGVLADAKKVGISKVWFQPGTFDEEIFAQAKKEFEVVVGGEEEGSQGEAGWCVIADGERVLGKAGRAWKKQEL